MDAGPVVAQKAATIDPNIQAPQLLRDLFAEGTELLLSNLERVWSGNAAQAAIPQVSCLIKFAEQDQ